MNQKHDMTEILVHDDRLMCIARGIDILNATITDTGVRSNDEGIDDDGYESANATTRSIEYGWTPSGDLMVFMVTNGDPVLLTDSDLDAHLAWCHDMGDRPDNPTDRIRRGCERLEDAIANIERVYDGNRYIADHLGFYQDIVEEVRRALNDSNIIDGWIVNNLTPADEA